MEWTSYILFGFIFASLFFVAAALALFWAHKHGQLSNMEEGSKVIFDQEEPMGIVSDQVFSRKKEGTKKSTTVS